jgi:hypothetical protein
MALSVSVAYGMLLLLATLRHAFAQLGSFENAQRARPMGPAQGSRTPDSSGAEARYEGCALGAIITSNINQPGVHMVTHSRAYVF